MKLEKVLLLATMVALTPLSLAQQCTVGSPSKFEPPPGIYPGKFAPGYASSLSVYGPPGARKLLMKQNFGYSIFSLSNPQNPALENFRDIEQDVPLAGDGFETVLGVAGAPDGSRAIVGYKQVPNGTLLLKPQGSGFTYAGDFSPTRPLGGSAILQKGSRYLGFALTNASLGVADITTLGSGTTAKSIPNELVAGAPGGNQLQVAGNIVVYLTSASAVIVDASIVGPIGQLSNGFVVNQHTNAALGLPGNALAGISAAIHPISGDLYVLVEGKAGNSTTGFVLFRSTNGGATLLPVGSAYVPPPPYSGASSTTPGVSTLVPTSDSVTALFWGQTTGKNKLYTMNVSGWGTDLTPGAEFDSAAFQSQFPGATVMRGFASGTTLYTYFGTGVAAFALPISCPVPVASAPTSLYTVNPCRVVDTRDSSPLQPNETRELTLSGSCGIQPSDVSLALNVTALNATQSGDLTVLPASQSIPQTQNVSFSPGRTLAGSAIVSPSLVNGQARLKIRNRSAGTVHVILDVAGVFR